MPGHLRELPCCCSFSFPDARNFSEFSQCAAAASLFPHVPAAAPLTPSLCRCYCLSSLLLAACRCPISPSADAAALLLKLFFAGGVEAEGSRCSGDQRRVAAALCLQCTPEMAGGRRLEVSVTASLRLRGAGAGLRGAHTTVTCPPPAAFTGREHATPSPVCKHESSSAFTATKGVPDQDWTSLL